MPLIALNSLVIFVESFGPAILQQRLAAPYPISLYAAVGMLNITALDADEASPWARSRGRSRE